MTESKPYYFGVRCTVKPAMQMDVFQEDNGMWKVTIHDLRNWDQQKQESIPGKQAEGLRTFSQRDVRLGELLADASVVIHRMLILKHEPEPKV